MLQVSIPAEERLDPNLKVAYQGTAGAYSHLASQKIFPNSELIACEDFQTAIRMVERGEADRAMIPVENSTAGRVEEIYRLLPSTHLTIVGEHFEPVNHCLLALPTASLASIKQVSSHPQALAQCFKNIEDLGITPIAAADTAVAAEALNTVQDIEHAAIASSLAADLYGLQVLKNNFQDVEGNTTRFIVLALDKTCPLYEEGTSYLTSLLFSVRNIPAALYKTLGGFATNGVNIIKLESYMDGGTMAASHFHIDFQGHPEQKSVQFALEELEYFAKEVRILGTYHAAYYRSNHDYV